MRVDAIIPTIGRSSLRESVLSVLAQEHCEPRAIVVLDAPAEISFVQELLEGLPYRMLVTNEQGGAAARNVGLDNCDAEYIGYLDDDDIWRPEKSHRQIQAIEKSANPQLTFSVTATEFLRADGQRSPKPALPYSNTGSSFPNYLVERKTIKYRPAYFNTITLFGPRELMQAVRWDEQLRKHQDWDLLIRLMRRPEVTVAVLEDRLAAVTQGSPGSVSRRRNWQDGANWLMRHDEVVTGRARADFTLLHVILPALHNRDLSGLIAGWRLAHRATPHLAALIRAAAGVISGR